MCAQGEAPALQVIVLGSGGGPREDNTTAFLVRSTAAEWRRGCLLAVDAGTHLAAVARILENCVTNTEANPSSLPVTLTSGPFKGLPLPCKSTAANAAHIAHYLVDTYLITHPHLDHISGFVINTAGLPGTRPKRLAALPSTIAAFKTHIFNNVIWPNLSDENNGVGLVTYMRLVDGGSPALGDGDGKGYVEVCEGLSVKALSVSHGHCMENHSHRGSGSGLHSHDSLLEYEKVPPRSNSISLNNGRSPKSPESFHRRDSKERICVYDSSAYFIRDVATGREVLIFGDVEPDSMSLSPRNLQVWTDAAPKVASGVLTAIFIECSYSDSQHDDQLYGHLVPRFLLQEMKVLANCVEASRQDENGRKTRKRKRPSVPQSGDQNSLRRSSRVSTTSPVSLDARRLGRGRLDSSSNLSPTSDPSRSLELDGPLPDSAISPHAIAPWSGLADRSLHIGSVTSPSDDPNTGANNFSGPVAALQPPLKGLKIVIIHVKDKMDDAEPAGDIILREMQAYEEEEKLGCEYMLANAGMAVYL